MHYAWKKGLEKQMVVVVLVAVGIACRSDPYKTVLPSMHI